MKNEFTPYVRDFMDMCYEALVNSKNNITVKAALDGITYITRDLGILPDDFIEKIVLNKIFTIINDETRILEDKIPLFICISDLFPGNYDIMIRNFDVILQKFNEGYNAVFYYYVGSH
jgi:hypothetical protein